MEQKKEFYIGIDIGKTRAMISLYVKGREEPETVSTVRGMEKFGIPTAMFLEKNGSCYYGEEALKRREQPDGDFFDKLYEMALAEQQNPEEETFLYRGLLLQFIRRLIRLKERYGLTEEAVCTAITVPSVDCDVIGLFHYLRQELGKTEEELILMDYAESFFLHTYHQEAVLWQHDVAMFYFQDTDLYFYLLHRNGGLRVQLVRSEQKKWEVPEQICTHPELKDEYFANIVRESFAKHAISTVYFIGDGFDGNWLKESLRVMGRNKRGFLGKNLLTRGAAYGAWRYTSPDPWGFFFPCSYKTPGEVSVRVESDGKEGFVRLVEAGQNWFCTTPVYKLLYDGTPELTVQVKRIGAGNSRMLHFTLTDLPDRPQATIRFRLQAKLKSSTEVILRLEDDGFGAFYKSSGKVWEFPVDLGADTAGSGDKTGYGYRRGGK